MRVPSVAVLAALMVIAHAAPSQNSPPTLPSTPEIVRMFSEPAASVEKLDTSESLEGDSDEAATSLNNQAKRSSYAPPPPPPPKQFCIEIRPKNPSQSPFVICEPPTQQYYPYPPPQNPYPYQSAPPAYPSGPSAYSPPTAPHSPPQTGGKPYQRSNAMGFNADGTMMTIPLMGVFRDAGVPPVYTGAPPMQFPSPSNPSPKPSVLQPSLEPVIPLIPPPVAGRSNYPQPYGAYDQTRPVTMQCHTPPGYQSYHGYQNPVALLQLFLKPSHHHHHHPGYYSAATTEAPSYRAAAVEGSTTKPNVTLSTTSKKNQTTASDKSTEGPLRVPIPLDGLSTDSPHAPPLFKGPHMTPEGSHPDTKKIPGITSPGNPPQTPVFQPGGGAALQKPINASSGTKSAPKMSDGDGDGDDDIAVNMVDGPPPMGRSGVVSPFAGTHQPWAAFRAMGGNDIVVPENIPQTMFLPTDSDMPHT